MHKCLGTLQFIHSCRYLHVSASISPSTVACHVKGEQHHHVEVCSAGQVWRVQLRGTARMHRLLLLCPQTWRSTTACPGVCGSYSCHISWNASRHRSHVDSSCSDSDPATLPARQTNWTRTTKSIGSRSSIRHEHRDRSGAKKLGFAMHMVCTTMPASSTLRQSGVCL